MAVRGSGIIQIVGLCGGICGFACAQTNVVFPDPMLEFAVRSALNQSTGSLTCSDLAALIALQAPSLGITNLSGLECATNLVELDLSGNALTGLLPFRDLTALRRLSVNQNHITDLSPLRDLVHLTQLNAGDNLIVDAGELSGLTNLAGLWLYRNFINDLAFVTNLNQLESLGLDDNRVSNPSPLHSLTNLTLLGLGGNRVTNYSVISVLPRLTTLSLRNGSITNLAGLGNLSRLSFMDLAENQISDLSPLLAATNLTHLVLNRNPLTNLSTLAPLTKLIDLELREVAASNLEFMAAITGLQHLDLADNSVADLTPLEGLTNLRSVVLSGNPINDYAGLTGLTNLTGLWLVGQNTIDLALLGDLTRLKTVSLRKCRLNSLTGLEPLVALSIVHADFNRLTNITALENLPHLSWVGLAGNLLSTNAGSDSMSVIEDLMSGGVVVNYSPEAHPPLIWAPERWYIGTGATNSLPFYVFYELDESDSLPVTGHCLDVGLIPDQAITISGGNGNRILTASASSNTTGASTILLRVSNEAGLTNQASVSISVMQPLSVTNMLAPGETELDPELEAALRSASGNDVDELTSVDLLRITALYADDADFGGFVGWQWLSNLTSLSLMGNTVGNLGFLTNIPQLTELDLVDTAATDLSPLGTLTNLTSLYLFGPTISNLAFLTPGSQLQTLWLERTRITDLNPIIAIDGLNVLGLRYSSVSNISVLASLPALSYADVRLNLLDLSPGSIASVLIEQLQGLGVEVKFAPQRSPPEIIIAPEWQVLAGKISTLTFQLRDESVLKVEGLGVGAKSSNTNLVEESALGVSVDINSDTPEWILAVSPAPGLFGDASLSLNATNEVGLVSTQSVNLIISTPMPVNQQLPGMSDPLWRVSASDAWAGQTGVTFQGFPAAQSANIIHGMSSSLEAELIGPGTLSFWWKVSSEYGYDRLIFESSSSTAEISGERDWEQRTIKIPPRIQVVRWEYTKDSGWSRGSDAGWLARVVFVPHTWLCMPSEPISNQCFLDVYGVPGQEYELQLSTNLVNWFTLATIVSTNRITRLIDDTSQEWMRFYRAKANLAPPKLNISTAIPRGVEVSWDASGMLESAPTPSGPWEDLGGDSPVFFSVGMAAERFFRVRSDLAPPTLGISMQEARPMEVSWPGLGVLESAPSLLGPWMDLGGVSPVRFSPEFVPAQFFRVRLPDE